MAAVWLNQKTLKKKKQARTVTSSQSFFHWLFKYILFVSSKIWENFKKGNGWEKCTVKISWSSFYILMQ